MTKHWAVMNDTGEVIATGDTFAECQRKAFATRRWVDPNTGEFMPAGSTCPYRLQTWEPLEGAVVIAPTAACDVSRFIADYSPTGRTVPKFEPAPWPLPKVRPTNGSE